MAPRNILCRRRGRTLTHALLVSWWCWVSTANVAAQAPLPFDPDKFFDSFLGTPSAAEREQLARVPVSVREERQVGQSALKAFRRQLARNKIELVERGKDVTYVKGLVKQLRGQMRNAKRYRNIEVLVADTELTDARSFPGGTVVVFRGLIDFCETEAALVGILGHELSHFDRGHQLVYLKQFKRMQSTFQNGFDPRQFTQLGGSFARMFARPFRPEEESEADRDGAKWAFALGYEPADMARVFKRLAERDGDQARLPGFLRSHPMHEDRFRAILKQGDALKQAAKRQQPLYLGRQNLQQRTPKSKRVFADEFVR